MTKEKRTTNDYIKDLTGKEMPKVEKKGKEVKKIISILGTAGSRSMANWGDSRCEFWGVAHCLLLSDIKKLDKVFEIHLPYIYNQEISPFSQKPIIYHANKEYSLGKYQKDNFGMPCRDIKDITAILPVQDNNINKYEIFPREEIKAKYKDLLPPSDAFYATNSIAWMICLAIEQKPDRIELWGIHLETDSEWQYERPCVEFWLGIARGMGIEIYIPEAADLLKAYHEYGFADIEVRRKKLKVRLDNFQKNIQDYTSEINRLLTRKKTLIENMRISFKDKVVQMENEKKRLQEEIKKYNEKNEEDKIKFEKNIKDKMQKEVINLDVKIRQLENRASAFHGGREQIEYEIKQLNA